jgi:hypothetical protein
MQFLSMREFSKTPKTALSRLASEGKAVLTSNGKPAALMINVDAENFEMVFGIVQEAERRMSGGFPPLSPLQPNKTNMAAQTATATTLTLPNNFLLK